jgi:hypothetical protein
MQRGDSSRPLFPLPRVNLIRTRTTDRDVSNVMNRDHHASVAKQQVDNATATHYSAHMPFRLSAANQHTAIGLWM